VNLLITRNLSALFHRSYLSGPLALCSAFIRGRRRRERERKIQTERIWNINKKTPKSAVQKKAPLIFLLSVSNILKLSLEDESRIFHDSG
jgi:hypothetical protein